MSAASATISSTDSASAVAHRRRLSTTSSSSSSSSSSSAAGGSTSLPSLKPQRRSSPLKRQMSLTATSSDPAIDPHRSHASGPLAVLYSVPPERDPLVGGSNTSPARIFTNADDSIGASGSPGRSLLSAFQAVSPNRPNGVASLLSGGGSAVGLRSAGTGNTLQPASPIASPQRRTSSYTSHNRRGSISGSPSRSINWASDAMRAANGVAVSPATSRSIAVAAVDINRSPERTVQASPRRQAGVVYSPVKQAEATGKTPVSSCRVLG